jgi:hypothetical protein
MKLVIWEMSAGIFGGSLIVGTPRAFLEQIIRSDLKPQLGSTEKGLPLTAPGHWRWILLTHESRASVVLPGCARPPRWGPGFFIVQGYGETPTADGDVMSR